MTSPSSVAIAHISELLVHNGYCHLRDCCTEQSFVSMCSRLGEIVDRCLVRVKSGSTSYLMNPAPIPFHNDSPFADLIGWHCISQDAQGGDMYLKDMRSLYETYPCEFEEIAEVAVRYPAVPNLHSGGWRRFVEPHAKSRSFYYAPWLIDSSNHFSGRGKKALQLLDEFPGMASVRITIKPGEVLLIDNQRFLHGRKALAPYSNRSLLRLWIRRPGEL